MNANKTLDINIKKKIIQDQLDENNSNKLIDNSYENWKDYKKKNQNFFIKKKAKPKLKINLFLINTKKKLLYFLKENLNNMLNLKKNGFFFNDSSSGKSNKNVNNFIISNVYTNLNFQKIKKIDYSLSDYYKKSEKFILIIDNRFSKIRSFIMYNNKCVFSLTSGIIYKKAQMKSKNMKKSEKMVNLIIKASIMKLKNNVLKNLIINLKGSKSNTFNIVSLIKKQLKMTTTLIYTPYITINRIKFKKVKSIKRRLKKKFIRLK